MKKSSNLAGLAIAMVGSALVMPLQMAMGAPVQWRVEDGGNGHWYQEVYISSGIRWGDASVAAANTSYLGQAGYLATLTSEAENNFVAASLLETAPGWARWLGGHQAGGSVEPAGGWYWTTGETWAFTKWDQYPYHQPDNNGNENCLNIWTRNIAPYTFGCWNDYNESTLVSGYIVEFTPEPATLSLLVLGGLAVLRRRRK